MRGFDSCVEKTRSRPDQFILVLRKWANLNPGMEFRCFVKKMILIAICQRDEFTYFPFLKGIKEDILNNILAFFNNHLYNKFFDQNFIFDVYISSSMKVYLVDFNPYGISDSLLFSWDEIQRMEVKEDSPEFRMVQRQSFLPSLAMRSRLPFDLVNVSSISQLIGSLEAEVL